MPPMTMINPPDFGDAPQFDRLTLHPTTMRCLLEMALHPDVDLDHLTNHVEQMQQMEGEGTTLTLDHLKKHTSEDMLP